MDFLLIISFISVLASDCMISEAVNVTWCSVSIPEQAKCLALSAAIKKETDFEAKYTLNCAQGNDEFDCMQMVKNFKADLVNLDAGLGFYASRFFSLRPIAVENYNEQQTSVTSDLIYYANIVVPKSKGNLNPYLLRGEEICFAGAGTAEGWTLPLATLLGDMKAVPVTQCNNVVQNLIGFLGDSCIPGALNEIFNPFGDNTQEICKLCSDLGYQNYCTYSDRYARNQGSLKCLHEHNNNTESKYKPSAAFVRAREIELAALDGFPMDQYQLLCPTKDPSGSYMAPITSWASCNWGNVSSRMIMTSLTQIDVAPWQNFLKLLIKFFGSSPGPFANATFVPAIPGIATVPFKLFRSSGYADPTQPNQPTRHLMFSDFTRSLLVPPDADISSYYRWMSSSFRAELDKLNQCPLPTIRWCVLDEWEMEKCQTMRSAFAVRGIKPDLVCILGNGTNQCMQLIKAGFVDIINLEAGDLYTAGRYFGLVPIVAENYGIGTFFYAVAVARKREPVLLISNWKYARTCHSGVGKSTGWVIPLNTILDTVQVRVLQGRLIYSLGELVSRACVPGILDDEYNTDMRNSINLCEICSSGNADRCQRNNRELYYGDTGAFRCLVEGGDIAFTRHSTVHANTASRNPNYWARNQREDDYELLCADGQRKDIHRWSECNLAKIPSNTIVTSNYKTENDRLNIWRMLQYGQEYYSSDIDPVFAMFNSDFYHKDLLFSDETDSLSLIPWQNQDYVKWLGPEFLRLVTNLENIAEGSSQSGIHNAAATRHSHANLLLASTLLLLLFL